MSDRRQSFGVCPLEREWAGAWVRAGRVAHSVHIMASISGCLSAGGTTINGFFSPASISRARALSAALGIRSHSSKCQNTVCVRCPMSFKRSKWAVHCAFGISYYGMFVGNRPCSHEPPLRNFATFCCQKCHYTMTAKLMRASPVHGCSNQQLTIACLFARQKIIRSR